MECIVEHVGTEWNGSWTLLSWRYRVYDWPEQSTGSLPTYPLRISAAARLPVKRRSHMVKMLHLCDFIDNVAACNCGVAHCKNKQVFFCTVRWSSLSRAVLTNGHTGHVPGPPDFFFFLRGPNWLWWNKILKTNYLITFAKINCKGNPVNTF